jgi:hypothetical protein
MQMFYNGPARLITKQPAKLFTSLFPQYKCTVQLARQVPHSGLADTFPLYSKALFVLKFYAEDQFSCLHWKLSLLQCTCWPLCTDGLFVILFSAYSQAAVLKQSTVYSWSGNPNPLSFFLITLSTSHLFALKEKKQPAVLFALRFVSLQWAQSVALRLFHWSTPSEQFALR